MNKKRYVLCRFVALLAIVGLWLFLKSDLFLPIIVKTNSIYCTIKYSRELSIAKSYLLSIASENPSKSSEYFYNDYYFKERPSFLPCFSKKLKYSNISELKMLNLNSKDLNQEFNTAVYLDNDSKKYIILKFVKKSSKWVIYSISVSDKLGHELQDQCEKG